jgi:hypothetical protein
MPKKSKTPESRTPLRGGPMPAFFKERLRKCFGEAYADAAEKGDVEAMKRHYFDTHEPPQSST